MPNKRKEGERARSPKLKTATETVSIKVSGKWENAIWHERVNGEFTEKRINDGDTVKVQAGAPYKPGDIVAFECSRCGKGTYHAQHYHRTGRATKYDFQLSIWESERSGKRYKDGEVNIIGPVVLGSVTKAEDAPQAKETKKAARLKTFTVALKYPYPAFGLYMGDIVTYNANGTASPGKFIGIHTKNGSWFARVCLNDERGIYIVEGNGERDWLANYNYKSFGLVVEIKRASQVNAEKVKALRAKLDELGDGDSCLNMTRAYEIEREIYDLEHPKDEETATPEVSDDWPDHVGEGGTE
jgi:hypothetical protein